MDVLHVFPALIGGERVHLDTEGHAFLPAVLPGGELGTDAVHLSQKVGKTEFVVRVYSLAGWGGAGVSVPG